MRLALLSALNAERANRRPCLVLTPLDGGDQVLLRAESLSGDPLADALAVKLRDGTSGIMETGGRRFFVDVHLPPPRLIVIGAVHIAQYLAPMARLAGLDVFIVDPRAAFASAERFPDVRLLAQWPDEALPALGLDAFTCLAALTHDPKIDDLALRLALDAECFFIGALGSQTSHGRRVERLLASGVDARKIARIRAPIGLDIGAVTPAEIAVSILAEIILAMGKKPLRGEKQGSRRDFACV
jgi:xanthine dehydrogenase accessory factor